MTATRSHGPQSACPNLCVASGDLWVLENAWELQYGFIRDHFMDVGTHNLDSVGGNVIRLQDIRLLEQGNTNCDFCMLRIEAGNDCGNQMSFVGIWQLEAVIPSRLEPIEEPE